MRGLLLIAVLSTVFLYGVGVGVYQWPPFPFLKAAKQLTERGLTATKSAHPVTLNVTYGVTTYSQSYFQLDSNGELEVDDKGLPIRSEGRYYFEQVIDPSKTAVVIMDPWIDMASPHLDEYYGQITESKIIPLVAKALERGHPIITLTNDPAVVRYNTKVHPEIAELATRGQSEIIYHQDFNDDEFASYLHSKGIDALIYVGFASNMCVIGRRMGMISMFNHGFRLYFVPEASAAVEYPDTWDDQFIHQATIKIISQWIAKIIAYDEFMAAAATKQKPRAG